MGIQKVTVGCVMLVGALSDLLPSTLTFVDHSYSGYRFKHKNIVVFGGTSGMGFATAAMFVQECANFTVVASRNPHQGLLAASVLRNISRAHCGMETHVQYSQADIRRREDVRQVLSLFQSDLHIVVNTAAIPGFIGTLGDIHNLPSDYGQHDGLYNNVYGAFHVTSEALMRWEDKPMKPFMPAMVHFSSQQGMAPCASCATYSASKHAIIGMVTSVAANMEGKVRVNAVLPGLVDTPFTWNQLRGVEFAEHNKTYVLQPWQCFVDGKIIDANCPGGGSGYGCPCEDVSVDNPGVKKMIQKLGAGVWPPMDPRKAGAVVLDLVDPASEATGITWVVDELYGNLQQFQCHESNNVSGTKPLWNSCPRPNTSMPSWTAI